MNRFYQMAEAANRRFPDGATPYQMATRLLEECGEVAKEINHWESSGIKREKYGEPSRKALATELRQAISELFKIAKHYGVEAELEASIDQSLARSRAEGLIE